MALKKSQLWIITRLTEFKLENTLRYVHEYYTWAFMFIINKKAKEFADIKVL